MRVPIKFRLTAWYVTLLAVILVALGAFLLIRLRSDLLAAIDHSLATRAAQIALNYEVGGESDFKDVSDASLSTGTHGETGAQILSASLRVLQDSGDPVVSRTSMLPRADVHPMLRGGRVERTLLLGPDREPFRVLAVRIPHGQVLVVSESLEEVNSSAHRLFVLLLLAGPVVLAAAGAGGWWLSRKALHPVTRMTEAAASIGVDRLDERIAVPRTSDEIERLGRTLNAMLDRLQRGVAEKHHFVADASHELRTPLAIMRSEIDVSLRSDELPPSAREVLQSATQELDRMSATVENLLTLARIDEGNLQLLRAPVALAEVAASVAGKLRPLADAKRIHLDVGGDGAVVQGDRERLDQAVTNLVENALKYTEAGGDVIVSVWRREGESGLTVSDTGSGIPTDTLPRIFDRFVRADASRSSAAGGSGLGLAICREIVEAHGGRVWAESETGRGSVFSLAFPAAP